MIDDDELVLSEPPLLVKNERSQNIVASCSLGPGLHEVSGSGSSSNCRVFFLGCLSNQKEVSRKLNIEREKLNDAEIVAIAYRQFGSNIKELLVGDFSLLLVDDREKVCIVWRHQLSSHPLFLSQVGNKLWIAQRLEYFQEIGRRQLDENALTELLHWGVITGNLTLVKEVSQLEIGEFQQWKIGGSLELVEKSVSSIFTEYAPADSGFFRLEDVNYQIPKDLQSSEAFKQLPDLSLRQDFPVTCQEQIESFFFLKACSDKRVICDLGLSLWGRAHTFRFSEVKTELEIKSLYLTEWARSRRPLDYLKDRKSQLEQMQIARGENSECWQTWIKLRYWLPLMQGLLRNQAESLDKEIHFLVNQPFYRKFGGMEPELSFSNNSSIWRIDDEPIVNLFESMQRMFAFGTKNVTKKIFHFAPPMTGSLVRRFHDRTDFQEFCMTCLTLDYLARFKYWTIE